MPEKYNAIHLEFLRLQQWVIFKLPKIKQAVTQESAKSAWECKIGI